MLPRVFREPVGGTSSTLAAGHVRRSSLRTIIASMAAFLSVLPVTSHAQGSRALLEEAAAALGASGLTTLEFASTGTMYDTGQSAVAGQRGPQFTLKSYARSINHETGSIRTEFERARAEARGGGSPAPRQIHLASGDYAWNVVGDADASARGPRRAPVPALEQPIHGRMVPMAELNRAIGRAP
jgi:hypothetical protein